MVHEFIDESGQEESGEEEEDGTEEQGEERYACALIFLTSIRSSPCYLHPVPRPNSANKLKFLQASLLAHCTNPRSLQLVGLDNLSCNSGVSLRSQEGTSSSAIK